MDFKKGQVNAYELPKGCFISCETTRKRLNLIRNNARYRENLEKACRKAGYVDKLLVVSRGSVEDRLAIESLLRQNERAEHFSKVKGYSDEEAKSTVICAG